MRSWGLSAAEQDEVWRRWRQGESLRLIARRLGKRGPSVRAFVLQTGGVQRYPPHRAVRCLSMADAPMGYRGKVVERQQARQLRQTGLPLAEIAARVGASKSSVSLWVRDVPFDTPVIRPPRGRRRDPKALQRRKQGEIERLLEEGRARIGRLSERESWSPGSPCTQGRAPRATGASASRTAESRRRGPPAARPRRR